MKREIIVATLLIALVAGTNPVSAQSNNSTVICENTNNSSVQKVCNRVDTLEGRVEALESENQGLQAKTKNTKQWLNNLDGIPPNQQEKVRSAATIEGKIAKIEAYLGGSSNFDSGKYDEYQDLGAWDYRQNRPGMPDGTGPGPAFMRWIGGDNAGIQVFVGAGNGDYGSKNQWRTVLSGGTELSGNITFTLPYAPKGVDEKQGIQNGIDSSATTEIKALIQAFNQPSTRYEWETWNNDQLQSSQELKFGSQVMTGFAALFLLPIGMFVQYKTRWFNRAVQKRKQRQNGIDVGTIHNDKTSVWTRTGRAVAAIPVIGTLLKKVWLTGNEVKKGVRRGDNR